MKREIRFRSYFSGVTYQPTSYIEGTDDRPAWFFDIALPHLTKVSNEAMWIHEFKSSAVFRA